MEFDHSIDQDIWLACERGQLDNVKRLLSISPDLLNEIDSKGFTLLHIACIRGLTDIVRLLLSLGADIYKRLGSVNSNPTKFCTTDGVLSLDGIRTTVGPEHLFDCAPNALHFACWNGHKDIIELLLDQGDPSRNNGFQTPPPHEFTEFTRKHGFVDKVIHDTTDGYFVDYCLSSGETPLHLSLFRGHHAATDLLMSRGARVYSKNYSGSTMLHFASIGGGREIVELLLANFWLNVNEKNDKKETPILWACVGGNQPAVEALLSHRADLNLANQDFSTPLYFACQGGHHGIVELLLSGGAYIGSWDRIPPLCRACEKGHYKIVETLLNAGVSVNAHAKVGARMSPLHYACCEGHWRIVELLLKRGARTEWVDRVSYTPLHYACKGGHPRVIELLLLYGADPRGSVGGKETPMMILESNKRFDLCLLLPNLPVFILHRRLWGRTFGQGKVSIKSKSVGLFLNSKPWLCYTVIQAMLDHGLPWSVQLMILVKMCTRW